MQSASLPLFPPQGERYSKPAIFWTSGLKMLHLETTWNQPIFYTMPTVFLMVQGRCTPNFTYFHHFREKCFSKSTYKSSYKVLIAQGPPQGMSNGRCFIRWAPSPIMFRNKVQYSGLCSSRARWPLAPNFCPQETRKSQIFHTNHMLGTLDFTVSEHWAPFNFP